MAKLSTMLSLERIHGSISGTGRFHIRRLVIAGAILSAAGCGTASTHNDKATNDRLDLSGSWQLLQQDDRSLQPRESAILQFLPAGVLRISNEVSTPLEGQYRLETDHEPPQLWIQLGDLAEYHIARLRTDGLLELAQGESSFPLSFDDDGLTHRLYRPIAPVADDKPIPGDSLQQRLQGTWTGSKKRGSRISSWVVDYQQGGLARMLEVTIDSQFQTYQRIDITFHWSLEDEVLVETHSSGGDSTEIRYSLVNLTHEVLECRFIDGEKEGVHSHRRAPDFETAIALLPASPAGYRVVRGR